MSDPNLSTFVSARIDEHPDPAEATRMRRLWNAAHEQVDASTDPSRPVFLPGEVKDWTLLRELASEWRNHPDYPKAVAGEELDLSRPNPSRRMTFEQSMDEMQKRWGGVLRKLAPYDHTFQVTAWREEPYWVLDIEAPQWALDESPSHGYWCTQTPWLRLAEFMAKDYLVCVLDLDYGLFDQISVRVTKGIGPAQYDGDYRWSARMLSHWCGVKDTIAKWRVRWYAKRSRRETLRRRVSF